MLRFAPTPLYMRGIIAVLIGIAGALVMLAIDLVEPHMVGSDIALAVLMAFLGAFLGGFLTAPLFGQSAPGAVFLACLGALLATTIGAALGGLMFGVAAVLIDGSFGMIGDVLVISLMAVVVVGTLIATTAVGLIWLPAMGAIHLLGRYVLRRLVQGT